MFATVPSAASWRKGRRSGGLHRPRPPPLPAPALAWAPARPGPCSQVRGPGVGAPPGQWCPRAERLARTRAEELKGPQPPGGGRGLRRRSEEEGCFRSLRSNSPSMGVRQAAQQRPRRRRTSTHWPIGAAAESLAWGRAGTRLLSCRITGLWLLRWGLPSAREGGSRASGIRGGPEQPSPPRGTPRFQPATAGQSLLTLRTCGWRQRGFGGCEAWTCRALPSLEPSSGSL